MKKKKKKELSFSVPFKYKNTVASFRHCERNFSENQALVKGASLNNNKKQRVAMDWLWKEKLMLGDEVWKRHVRK